MAFRLRADEVFDAIVLAAYSLSQPPETLDMTRGELLHLLIGQARTHGFEFRRWYMQNTGMAWSSYSDSIQWLSIGRRAHMLLFSHGFAKCFFKDGERITFAVAPQTYERVTPSGEHATVNRRAHLRRSSRENVWLYHLREMAEVLEPLHYIRRFLITEETLAEKAEDATVSTDAEDDSYDNENLVR